MIRFMLVSLSLAISSIAQTAKPVELPDTPQGRIVSAYVKAFNSGDEKAMREFFSNNVAASSLAQRPVEARLEIYREMRSNMSSIEIRRVLAVRDTEVVVLMQTKQGDSFEFAFQFESGPPHKMLGIRVEDAEGPPSAAEADNLPPVITEAQLVEALDKHLTQAVAADEFSGTVIIAKKGSVLFQRAVGLASKEYNVPNSIDTKFNLGSINKIFTQIAIGQLVEQGKLAFDDKLGKHLPDYPNHEAAEKVTIRQLLDMKSGVGDFFGPEFEATPKNKLRKVKDFLPLFASKPLLFEPGTKQQYSNGGYIVLGAIVEKVSGRAYYDYVRENIFKIADMRDTDWYEADLATANLASGYTKEGSKNGVRRNNIYSRPAKGSPAGGGYSTAPDLLKFVAALREGNLRVPDFRSQQTTSSKSGGSFGGLGIAGGAPGINAVLEADEATGYAVVVMSNYDPPSAERIGRQIRGWISRVKN
jgi:D-alanyl-D-alanine carboxypeptidase